jgi:hypothetical protein
MKPTENHTSIVHILKRESLESDLFKKEVTYGDFYEAREKISQIAYFYLIFCQNHKLRAQITNVIYKQEWSKSDTHLEGRAIDFHCKSWPSQKKQEFMTALNSFFSSEAAISATTRKEKLCVLECEGENNEHLHIQLKR